MPRYLFRIEAVNLTPTVYDTADISTIRGGGFYLLHRVHELARHPPPGAEVVTEGASTAVFKTRTEDPDAFRKDLIEWLYRPGVEGFIKDMMFLVAYCLYEDPGCFAKTMAALQGKIRLRQLQCSNIRLFEESFQPTFKDSSPKRYRGFDQLNRVLPAHQDDPPKKDISNFTAKRRKFGKNLRNQIYRILLGSQEADDLTKNLNFTDNLEALSESPQMGNLSGKIAFIHIDGNKFGRLQADFSEEQLHDYDHELQKVKSEYLKAILKMAKNDATFRNNGSIRLETLLWGGDEIKLIVPAWMGWAVAARFYQVVQTSQPQMEKQGQTLDMTYAMGLVFAHHKNPIRNVSKLAEELVESVKRTLRGNPDPLACYKRDKGDRLHYLVLESLETLPSNYPDFCRHFYDRPEDELCLSAKGLIELREFVHALDTFYARSRTCTVARNWRQNSQHPFSQAYLSTLRRGIDLCEATQEQKTALVQLISRVTGAPAGEHVSADANADGGYRWLQAAELWDYISSSKELS